VLEKPRLDDDKIVACLCGRYGLTVTEIEFLPLGYDANAGVYRVYAGGQSYFLKVKRDAVYELSVNLPRCLQEQGFEPVIAPLPTLDGDLWGKVGEFSLILYPFIEGRSGWGAGLSDHQWIEFGALVKRLHTMRLPDDVWGRIPRETFVPHPRWGEAFRQLQAVVSSEVHENPFQTQLVTFWKDHDQEMRTIVERTGQLSGRLQDQSRELVLCHADIHTANLLVTALGELFVVDWDQPILAPIERDLMFVTGFGAGEREENLFFQGYGQTAIDWLVMAYYRYERVMEDLIEFAAQVFLRETSDETKQDSVEWFMVQFDPGGSVEAAHKLDDVFQI